MAREQEFRRRWFEAHRDRFVADQASYKQSISGSSRMTLGDCRGFFTGISNDSRNRRPTKTAMS